MSFNENVYKSIVEVSPFPVYVCSGDEMIITVANNATLKAWGRDKSVIGQPFSEALPELKDQPFRGLLSHVYETGNTYFSSNDRADLMVDGRIQTFYFKFTYQPLRDSNNIITSVLCFATDVTELERSRQAVEASQNTLYNIIKQAPVAICILDANDLTVQVVNDSYLELVRKTRSELENQPVWEAVPEAAELYAPILNNVIKTGETYYAKEHEVILIRQGAEELVFIDFVYEPISDINGKINTVMVIGMEITEKVIARRLIEEAEERARLAIDAAEIGSFDLDMATGNMVTSIRFNQIFGISSTPSRNTILELIHPDDIALRDAAYEFARNTGKLFYEARFIWKDGSIHWVRVQGKLYLGTDTHPTRILGTVLDITEFKHLQQQKDDFISVASHELKTPLTSVKASMQLLERLIRQDPTSDKVSLFIDKANSSLTKMHHLVESLLNVSKIAADQLVLNKSNFIASEMIKDCCEHIRLTGKYNLVLSGDMELVFYADKNRIDQVLVNFINNAVKYAPESDTINIHISKEGDNSKLSVQDFGRGIPAEKLPHLFERYYRVDSSGVQYSGLGLGLYISADIIERHGGKIGVYSEKGIGSTFWFTLPSV
ncbi:PAS domain-containing sensor histidine kinase [Daejeonella oryzae]|uniref:PAS domain-containing sensor histidine kinase n=1 Tax=Daejeonella oryzae TaxID=1122943 RepID=UPI000423A451|nr:PAS domain-containing sensor histidine kinase [Daejeonella oryzae]